MNKLWRISLSVLTIFSLVGCNHASKTQPTNITGDYSGTAKGMQGNVSVSLHIEQGKITDVSLTECHGCGNR